jgi:hypothetical protein
MNLSDSWLGLGGVSNDVETLVSILTDRLTLVNLH